MKITLTLLLLSISLLAFSQSWVQTNGPAGADVRCIAINAAQELFVGTQGGGVFRSVDHGTTWTAVNNGLTAKDVHALAINQSGTIFAGTYAGGVFRSTDNGDTWTQTSTGIDMPWIECLTINSLGHIFAGTAEGGGVYRSMDNGNNWSLVINGLGNTYVTAITVNAGDTLFAGTWGNGVYRSADNGNTWEAINSGLNAPAILSFAVNDSGYIFAGSDFGDGIYRSTDGGNNWTGLTIATNNNVYAIVIDSAGYLYAGTYGDGIFRSTNNGDTWTQVNTGLNAMYVLSMAVDSSNLLFAGTYFGGGVFRSVDNAATWNESNQGLISTDVRALVTNTAGDIFAGTYGMGVYRSTDEGNTWVRINNGLTGRYIRALAVHPNGDIYAGADFVNNAGGGVYKSTDNGDNWTLVSDSVIQDHDVRAIGISSTGDIYAATYNTGGVFKSTDNGATWTQMNNGMECTLLWSFAINSNDELFAGSAGCEKGVYRSLDNAVTWDTINNGMPYRDVAALAINTDDVLFAASQQFTGFSMNFGMFRSSDNGDTWTSIVNGLPADPNIQALTIDSFNRVYAGTSVGAYQSKNNGETWTAINTGLTTPDIRSLTYSQAGYVLAGTAGGGVFRMDILPHSEFTADKTIACTDDCIEFTSTSGFADSYQWTFTGGSPATSTSEQPANVCYGATGTYDAMLITTNSAGSDTLFLDDYITVNAAPTPVITQNGNWLSTTGGFASYQWMINNTPIGGADSSAYEATMDGSYTVAVTNDNGCAGTSSPLNVTIVGVNGLVDDGSVIYVYPNPANAFINVVSTQGIADIQLVDAIGKVLFVEFADPEKSLSVPVDHLANGVYSLRIRTVHNNSVSRVFVIGR